MIRKLKIRGARGLFLLAVAGSLGFCVLASAMGVVAGRLLMLGLRLAESAGASDGPRGCRQRLTMAPNPPAHVADCLTDGTTQRGGFRGWPFRDRQERHARTGAYPAWTAA